jgi:hypothetical protein
MSKTKLELTWIGKDKRPKLEPRILLEDPSLSYHAKFRRHPVKTDSSNVGANLLVPFRVFAQDTVIFRINLHLQLIGYL